MRHRCRPLLALVLATALAAGCGEEEPEPTASGCSADASPTLDLALTGYDYGTLVNGDDLIIVPPPQGGEPVLVLWLRTSGFNVGDDGLDIEALVARTSDGVQIAKIKHPERFFCSNVGTNGDRLVSSGFHVQFFGFTGADLDGEMVEISVSAEGARGSAAEMTVTGLLVFDDS